MRYRITDLGPAQKATDEITPALDQGGRALTWNRGRDFVVRAYLRDGSNSTELTPLPGYPDTYPADINGNTIVGTSRASADMRYYRAFLYRNGHMEDIGTLGGKYARAYAVNARGQVVGGANTAQSETHAFLREAQGGALRDLGVLAAGNYSNAEGVNLAGQVVGVANLGVNGKNHAFLWDKGQMQDLGVLPGGAFSHAHAINDAGQAVGWGDVAGETHAILWNHGKAQDLGVLANDPSSAWGINNRGQIVGASGFKPNRPLHAVLWENGRIQDLNDLIPPDSGWRLLFAYRINDPGQIVGVGTSGSELHAFLLTPLTRTGKSVAAGKTMPPPAHQQQNGHKAGMPGANQTVPAFSLHDMDGRLRSLAEFKGRRIALFFFCGCERCRQCAQTWGQLQHGGAIAPPSAASASSQGASTLVVYMGDADAAESFVQTTGLDAGQTLMLPDPRMEVTGLYQALPCPRVFVLDAQQVVCYVNSHKDDDPLHAAAATIDTRALGALNTAVKRTAGKGK